MHSIIIKYWIEKTFATIRVMKIGRQKKAADVPNFICAFNLIRYPHFRFIAFPFLFYLSIHVKI